jgi:hypothetical protein
MMQGANWAGMGARQVSATVAGKSVDAFQVGSEWFTVHAPSDWLTGRLMFGMVVTKQGDTRIVKTRTAHPPMCGCFACVRMERPDKVTDLALIDRSRFVGPLGRAYAPRPRWSHERSAQPNVDGIGRYATAVTSGILGTPERKPVPHTRIDGFERTLPKATPPNPDPPIGQPTDTAVSRAFRRAFSRLQFTA